MKALVLGFLMLVLSSSVYAGYIGGSPQSSIGGTGSVAVPRNVVEVTSTRTLLSGSASTGTFNQVSVTVTASVSATYTVYVTALLAGSVVYSQAFSGQALSSTPTALTTNTFTTQTIGTSNLEVDATATG